MRIIDQNGCDYPYESIAISSGDGIIYARPISNMDKQYLIAQYSAQEKAKKVMSMLRHTYEESKKFEAINRMVTGDASIPLDRFEDVVSSLCKNLFVFRFPAEDEI